MKKKNLNLAKLSLNKETVVALKSDDQAMLNGGGGETLISIPACCVPLPTHAPSCRTCAPKTMPCDGFTCPTPTLGM